MELTKDILDKLISADCGNIIKKIKSGKTLTQTELKRLREVSIESGRYVKTGKMVAAALGISLNTWRRRSKDPRIKECYSDKGWDVVKAGEVYITIKSEGSICQGRGVKPGEASPEIMELRRRKVELDNLRVQIIIDKMLARLAPMDDVKWILNFMMEQTSFMISSIPSRIHGIDKDAMVSVQGVCREVIIELKENLARSLSQVGAGIVGEISAATS